MDFAKHALALLGSLTLAACATTGGDAPGSPRTLIGPEWIVEDLAGHGVIDNARATLQFGADGQVTGDTSCNRYFASYRVAGAKLEIEKAGVTRRACAPAVMDQEQRFLGLFNAVNSYRIDETGALVLVTAAGTTITARTATATK